MTLNERASRLADHWLGRAAASDVAVSRVPSGAVLVDAGIGVHGSVASGMVLATLCLADLARVTAREESGRLVIRVETAEPWRACLASQYAGWKLHAEDYFAMGSGPFRAAAGKEELIQRLCATETVDRAVGVLESRRMPPEELVQRLATDCGVPATGLLLFVAPTASVPGMTQVVARSVETALHKLWMLGFDVKRVRRGWGEAPLPPVGKDDLAAMGTTNDAILYGGTVELELDASADELMELGPKLPSGASPAHGLPFARLFKEANFDFYKVDPYLFSPAVIRLRGVGIDEPLSFGRLEPEVLRRSFGQST